jgi:cobaltochelatase CobS
MTATTNIATSVAPATSVASATAPSKKPRVRKMHDLAALFPECPGIQNSVARLMSGFEEPGAMVPTRKPGFIQEQSFLEEFMYFMASEGEYMVCLSGPTGCGKTERVLDFFSRLNIPVPHMTVTKYTKPWELFGSMQIVNGDTVFQPALFVKAMKFGYPMLIDEAFNLDSKITAKLHMVRDRGEFTVDETGETIKAAKGFKVIMTANHAGYGDSSGFYNSEQQDLAFLNGIDSIVCDYPSPAIEEEIVQAALVKAHPAFATEPALADYAPRMVALANKVRGLFVGNESNNSTADRVEVAISTRTLIKWASAFVGFRGSSNPVHPLYRSLDFVCLRPACLATRTTVDALLLAEFGIDRTDKV